MQADAMLEKGDLDSSAVWKRVLRAVEELQAARRTAPAWRASETCGQITESACVTDFKD